MTIKELSEITGISNATISRVLKHGAKVSPEKLEILRKAIADSGDAKLQSKFESATQERKLIAFVVPDITNPFFTDVYRGAQTTLEPYGYELVILETNESTSREIRVLQVVQKLDTCGIIITPTSDGEPGLQCEQLLEGMRVPVVLVDRDVSHSSFDGVFIHNELGAYNAVKELIARGHRNIAIISGPLTTKPGRERQKGYLKALEDAGIPLNDAYVLEGDFSRDSGYHLTNRLLDEHPETTAIFSSNNMMTLGCLHALSDRGISPENDIEVISFDDVSDISDQASKITVVQRPTTEMGVTAAQIILDKCSRRDKVSNRRIILIPSLLRRR